MMHPDAAALQREYTDVVTVRIQFPYTAAQGNTRE
jgi:hypothetical protein